MRRWDKEKPAARTMVDRRQLLLGAATLLSMAVLLIIGLTPVAASAPDAQPDAAQVRSDSAQQLNADCQVIQRLSFVPCGHSLTRRQALPPELVGKARADLEAAYDSFQVTSFSSSEVIMEQSLDMFCPEHVVLMPDESGMLCIFQNRYGDALALVRELSVPLSELPDAYQEELRPGKGFPTQDDLTRWLESIES